MYRKYKADINSRASAFASSARATVDDQHSAVTMGTPAMEYVFMGRSGVKVSNICLGTMTFGNSNDGLFAAVGANIFLFLEQNYYARCLGDYFCLSDVRAHARTRKRLAHVFPRTQKEARCHSTH